MRQEPNTKQNPPEDAVPLEPVVVVEGGPPKPPEKNMLESREFMITVGLLLGVMLLGAVAIKLLAQWRRKQVEPGRWEAGIELNNFREMLEAGEITHSEYEKIREKMSTKIKKQIGVPKIDANAESKDMPPKDPEKT